MNLRELINESTYIKDEKDVILEDNEICEALILSPFIAFTVLKDKVSNTFRNVSDTAKTVALTPAALAMNAKEKLNAKLELTSGKGDNATVYKLTKEQKDFLVYIYRKYGREIERKIEHFRTNVMAPYQIVKRSVVNNKTLTDKEVHGMTKEEYERYRDSGAKKIKRMAHKLDDYKSLMSSFSRDKEKINEIRKEIEDVESGKIKRINPKFSEKFLSKLGYGLDDLHHWGLEELRKTKEEIDRLKQEQKEMGEKSKITIKGYTYNKEEINDLIYDLETYGYSNYKGRDISSGKGDFKTAFRNYIMRMNNIENINATSSYSKKIYLDILKDEYEKMNSDHGNSIKNSQNFLKDYKLNSYEEKIWGLKLGGKHDSGKLDDWYLKIKPEDFKGTTTFKKNDKIIRAEKEIDKQLKKFERDMKKVISDEDWKKLLKYRLINNFITVKELKSGKDMFKSASDYEKYEEEETSSADYTYDDWKDEIRELEEKPFSTIKELEKKQNEMKRKLRTLGKEDEGLSYGKEFFDRIDNAPSKATKRNVKIAYNSIANDIKEINDTEYTNVKEARKALKDLKEKMNDFKDNYPDDEDMLDSLRYSFQKAKDKIESFTGDE